MFWGLGGGSNKFSRFFFCVAKIKYIAVASFRFQILSDLHWGRLLSRSPRAPSQSPIEAFSVGLVVQGEVLPFVDFGRASFVAGRGLVGGPAQACLWLSVRMSAVAFNQAGCIAISHLQHPSRSAGAEVGVLIFFFKDAARSQSTMSIDFLFQWQKPEMRNENVTGTETDLLGLSGMISSGPSSAHMVPNQAKVEPGGGPSCLPRGRIGNLDVRRDSLPKQPEIRRQGRSCALQQRSGRADAPRLSEQCCRAFFLPCTMSFAPGRLSSA